MSRIRKSQKGMIKNWKQVTPNAIYYQSTLLKNGNSFLSQNLCCWCSFHLHKTKRIISWETTAKQIWPKYPLKMSFSYCDYIFYYTNNRIKATTIIPQKHIMAFTIFTTIQNLSYPMGFQEFKCTKRSKVYNTRINYLLFSILFLVKNM